MVTLSKFGMVWIIYWYLGMIKNTMKASAAN